MTSAGYKRTTLKDVAREAGVATGTVSMVLNDSPLVAEATRIHVQDVIRKLDYVYHRAAGYLRNNRTKTVGVSICNLTNPFYVDILAGIEQSLDSSGLIPFLMNCNESVPKQKRFFETLRDYNVQGLMLIPAIGTSRVQLEEVQKRGMYVVQVTRYIPGVESDYVGSDNTAASKMSVDYLAGLGHKLIAYIGHSSKTSTGRDLLKGYRQGLRAIGIVPKDDWIVECEVTREAGFKVVQQLFTQNVYPTALVCFNDTIAFGAMLGLAKLGLRPGVDCSVVGIQNVPESALTMPALTTVAVDCGLLGREASRLVRDRLESPLAPAQRILLKPKLIVRGSCGVPPTQTRTISRRRG